MEKWIKSLKPFQNVMVFALFSAILQWFMSDFIYIRAEMWHEPWRIFTAHWVHVGWWHYALNIMALWCLPLLFPKCSPWLIGFGILLLSPLLSLIIYFFLPNVNAYAGLSGILHGLYVLIVLHSISDPSERHFAIMMLVLIVGKLSWEHDAGAMSWTMQLIGQPVLTEAHLWGAGCGGLLGLGMWTCQSYRKIMWRLC